MTREPETAGPPRRILRTASGWGLVEGDDTPRRLRHSLAEMLAGAPVVPTEEPLDGDALAPLDDQEVWAAGVTYARSLRARAEESGGADVYDRVYASDRPELFFKSAPERVVGPGGTGSIRPDSGWDVPEPEVVLVLGSDGGIFGYTVGDDLSSRAIEGANPLYLPQAKIYDGSCVVGPWIVPAADAALPFPIEMRVTRQGEPVFEGSTSTEEMVRGFDDLASWLVRGLHFPQGVLLMTGTGIVPAGDFTLHPGDRVEITVGGVGRLEHGIGLSRPAGTDDPTAEEETGERAVH